MAVLILIMTVFTARGQTMVKQGRPVPGIFCISEQESDLYNMINEYRQKSGLQPIPLSNSLSYVAMLHAKDLLLSFDEQDECNYHSWSANGFWKPFCYPADENKKQSVWDKPRELTRYPGKAYEIVVWENRDVTPDSVMMVWQMEEYFNSFLLNTGKWRDQQWKAIGIALQGNYACAWFGLEPDPEGPPVICGQERPKPPADTLPVAKNTTREPIPAPLPVQKPGATTAPYPVTGQWYIIVRTDLGRQAALNFAEDLKTKGYPEATVLTGGGKIRISAFGPAEKPAASAKLKEIKKSFPDAWLLRQ